MRLSIKYLIILSIMSWAGIISANEITNEVNYRAGESHCDASVIESGSSGDSLRTEVIKLSNDDPGIFIISKPNETEIQILEENKPIEPNTTGVPNFVIKDRNHNFLMTIGGIFRPIVGWDMGNVLDEIDFKPRDIPIPSLRGNRSDFFINPLNSIIQFQVVGLPGSKSQLAAYLQLKYDGGSSLIKANHVYFTYRGILVGRTLSLFTDGAAEPYTVDPQGPNGEAHSVDYRISYQHSWKNGLSVAVGMEVPKFTQTSHDYTDRDYPDLDSVNFYSNASQPIPDIPAYIQYKGHGLNRIRLSGLIRIFRYVDDFEDKTRSALGWAFLLSGTVQPVKPLVFYYEYSYGHGYGNYIQGFQGVPVSFVPDESSPGKIKASPMMGCMIGVNYHFPKNIILGYIYSQANVWETGAAYPDLRYTQYMASNLRIPLQSFLTLGVEWLWGRKVNYFHESASINRLQVMMKFDF